MFINRNDLLFTVGWCMDAHNPKAEIKCGYAGTEHTTSVLYLCQRFLVSSTDSIFYYLVL